MVNDSLKKVFLVILQKFYLKNLQNIRTLFSLHTNGTPHKFIIVPCYNDTKKKKLDRVRAERFFPEKENIYTASQQQQQQVESL